MNYLPYLPKFQILVEIFSFNVSIKILFNDLLLKYYWIILGLKSVDNRNNFKKEFQHLWLRNNKTILLGKVLKSYMNYLRMNKHKNSIMFYDKCSLIKFLMKKLDTLLILLEIWENQNWIISLIILFCSIEKIINKIKKN